MRKQNFDDDVSSITSDLEQYRDKHNKKTKKPNIKSSKRFYSDDEHSKEQKDI